MKAEDRSLHFYQHRKRWKFRENSTQVLRFSTEISVTESAVEISRNLGIPFSFLFQHLRRFFRREYYRYLIQFREFDSFLWQFSRNEYYEYFIAFSEFYSAFLFKSLWQFFCSEYHSYFKKLGNSLLCLVLISMKIFPVENTLAFVLYVFIRLWEFNSLFLLHHLWRFFQ